MIPDDVNELPKMADILADRGDEVLEAYSCPTCQRTGLPPEALVDAFVVGCEAPRFRCTTCASGPHRVALCEQKRATESDLAPWDRGDGPAIKARIHQTVNETLWTTSSGSPLTAECRLMWREWRGKMFRLTIDFSDPADVIIPEQPALVYGE